MIGEAPVFNVVLLRLVMRLALGVGVFFVTGSLLELLDRRLVGDRLVSDWDALLGFLWSPPTPNKTLCEVDRRRYPNGAPPRKTTYQSTKRSHSHHRAYITWSDLTRE